MLFFEGKWIKIREIFKWVKMKKGFQEVEGEWALLGQVFRNGIYGFTGIQQYALVDWIICFCIYHKSSRLLIFKFHLMVALERFVMLFGRSREQMKDKKFMLPSTALAINSAVITTNDICQRSLSYLNHLIIEFISRNDSWDLYHVKDTQGYLRTQSHKNKSLSIQ